MPRTNNRRWWSPEERRWRTFQGTHRRRWYEYDRLGRQRRRRDQRGRLVDAPPASEHGWPFGIQEECPRPAEKEPDEEPTFRIKTIDHGIDPDEPDETVAAIKSVKYWCEYCYALMFHVRYYCSKRDYQTMIHPPWVEHMRTCYRHECPGATDPDTGEPLDERSLNRINFMVVNGRSVPYHMGTVEINNVLQHGPVPHYINQ